jgi:hypothetical protein
VDSLAKEDKHAFDMANYLHQVSEAKDEGEHLTTT